MLSSLFCLTFMRMKGVFCLLLVIYSNHSCFSSKGNKIRLPVTYISGEECGVHTSEPIHSHADRLGASQLTSNRLPPSAISATLMNNRNALDCMLFLAHPARITSTCRDSIHTAQTIYVSCRSRTAYPGASSLSPQTETAESSTLSVTSQLG